MQVAKQHIHGQWLSQVCGEERSGQAVKIATGEVAALYCDGTVHEAKAAVVAALRAFEHTCWKHSLSLRSGTVWSNSHKRLFAEAETGGFRDSGYERLHGAEGLNDSLQTKDLYFETHA